MPQFSIYTPQSPSSLRESLNKQVNLNEYNPIGLIGDTLNCSYGYDGESYYVTISALQYLAFGRMNMTFDQSKQAYEAVLFSDICPNNWDFDIAKKALKFARKNKLEGCDLFWHFVDVFSNM